MRFSLKTMIKTDKMCVLKEVWVPWRAELWGAGSWWEDSWHQAKVVKYGDVRSPALMPQFCREGCPQSLGTHTLMGCGLSLLSLNCTTLLGMFVNSTFVAENSDEQFHKETSLSFPQTIKWHPSRSHLIGAKPSPYPAFLVNLGRLTEYTLGWVRQGSLVWGAIRVGLLF